MVFRLFGGVQDILCFCNIQCQLVALKSEGSLYRQNTSFNPFKVLERSWLNAIKLRQEKIFPPPRPPWASHIFIISGDALSKQPTWLRPTMYFLAKSSSFPFKPYFVILAKNRSGDTE